MPSSIDDASKPVQRVPAWKRLGLKLKSASESPASAVETQAAKRKQSPIENDAVSKRVKVGPQVSPNTPFNPKTPSLTRKKSVSFTPETKIADGDSIKQLFNGWVAEQKEQDPAFHLQKSISHSALRTVEPSSIELQVDTTLNEKERRVKRVKKEKPAKISKVEQKRSSATVTSTPRPFLQYLNQYHNSRDTWKFNKNHQNHLLKHAFDVSVIPSDYSHLLFEYVRGLQGGVRTRLRDTALAIKVEDQEAGAAGFPATMADKDRRQRDYEAAIKEYIATMAAATNSADIGYEEGILLGLSDKAMEKRTARRMRSERILAELAEYGTSITDQQMHVENENGPFTNGDGAPVKMARKRKQRTVVVDESSSSESSDSSDTSSDEDEGSDSSGEANEDDSSSNSDSESDSGDSGDTEGSSEEGSGDD